MLLTIGIRNNKHLSTQKLNKIKRAFKCYHNEKISGFASTKVKKKKNKRNVQNDVITKNLLDLLEHTKTGLSSSKSW